MQRGWLSTPSYGDGHLTRVICVANSMASTMERCDAASSLAFPSSAMREGSGKLHALSTNLKRARVARTASTLLCNEQHGLSGRAVRRCLPASLLPVVGSRV